jgi:malonyl CoA-acyl carrier protein transacylase
MNILLLFAGQGFQQQNLFEIFQGNPKAIELLQEYSKTLSLDLLQPQLPITDPLYSQLIISAYQLTLFRIIEPLLFHHQIDCAGYSLGEVSAFLASSKASVPTVCKIITYRTQLMTSILTEHPINHYDLLFITGNFELETIETLCAKHKCYIAIINLQHHLVIGGTISNLTNLRTELQQYNVQHSKFLNIQLPSHTPFYLPKKGLFKNFLANMGLSTLDYPLFSPISLNKIYNNSEEQALLDAELFTCIQWNKVCELIIEYRFDLIIDLGPGPSMTNFLNLASTHLNFITAAKYKNIAGLVKSIQNEIAPS